MGEKKTDLIHVLNEALSAEYGALYLLPQHIAQVKDAETKRQLRLIMEMELEHAEKSAQMIYSLGGVPSGDIPRLKVYTDLREILESHVEGEKRSIGYYREAGRLADDPEMRKMIAEMQSDEEGHQRLLERLLKRVGKEG